MITSIESKAQYDAILNRIIELADMDPVVDSTEGKELETLARLVKDYERRAWSQIFTVEEK